VNRHDQFQLGDGEVNDIQPADASYSDEKQPSRTFRQAPLFCTNNELKYEHILKEIQARKQRLRDLNRKLNMESSQNRSRDKGRLDRSVQAIQSQNHFYQAGTQIQLMQQNFQAQNFADTLLTESKFLYPMPEPQIMPV